jgi:hypothetical protein
MRGLPSYEEMKNKRNDHLVNELEKYTNSFVDYYNDCVDVMLHHLQHDGYYIFRVYTPVKVSDFCSVFDKMDEDACHHMNGVIKKLERFLKDYCVRETETFNIETYRITDKISSVLKNCEWKPFEGVWKGVKNPNFAILIKFQD